MKVYIEWDTDGMDAEELNLPNEMEVPDDIETVMTIEDYLSDQTGFLVVSYMNM